MAWLDEIISKELKYMYLLKHRKTDVFRHSSNVLKGLSRSADEIWALRFKAIEHIIDYAYNNSRFYREKYREIGYRPGDFKSIGDLAKFPIVTREDLVNHSETMLCENISKDQYTKGSSGGTTGLPAVFYRDTNCNNYREGIDLALAKYYGWKDGQWQGWIWGATKDIIESKGLAAWIKKSWINRMFVLDITRLDTINYQKFIDETNKFRPTFVSAYPSLAYDLALRIESEEVGRARVRVISVTAEPLYEFQRKKIEEYLAENCYQRYGAREIGTVAFECQQKSGMHIFPDNVYLESVAYNEANKELGTLLVTDLINHAMPLIRYRINDLGIIDDRKCACGLNFPRLAKVKGRETDIIWRGDGTGMAGIKVVTIVRLSEINVPVQVIQKNIGEIRINIEDNPENHQEQLGKITSGLKKELGNEIKIEVRQQEKIARAKSGKYRYVISEVKRPSTIAKNK